MHCRDVINTPRVHFDYFVRRILTSDPLIASEKTDGDCNLMASSFRSSFLNKLIFLNVATPLDDSEAFAANIALPHG